MTAAKGSYTLTVRWGVSRGADSYGYTTCSLKVAGVRRGYCNGGGYDMTGTVLGQFIADEFSEELRSMGTRELVRGSRASFYGLSFHDPSFNPGRVVLETADELLGGTPGETIEEREAAGASIGLERYQAFHRASSPVPTERHTVALIDGACGLASVERIITALGYSLSRIHSDSRVEIYALCPFYEGGA